MTDADQLATATGPRLADVGWRLGEGADDLAEALTSFLDGLARPPRLLGLGEPTHLAEELPLLRNRVFEQLVEHAGYRSIALESDCLAALTVDDYVAGGPGELDEVVAAGFSHGWGAAPSNRELVAWMRSWNAAHDPDDRLRFAGFDGPLEIASAPSPRAALLGAHGFLAAHVDPALLPAHAATIERLAGADDRWARSEAMMDAARSMGGDPEVAELRLIADDLLGLFVSQLPELVAATSARAVDRALLHARTAAGLLRYHATMAVDSPRRMSRLSGLRDAMMADNLAALVEAESDRGPTLVYAHNTHLKREISTMQLDWGPFTEKMLWWGAGAITATRLGEDYAFVAMTVGCGPERGLGAPEPRTVEGELAALGEGPVLVDARRFAAALRASSRRPVAREDTTTDRGYFGFDPEHLGSVQGIVHVERIGPMIPSPY
ncbi:erythromycin esterase family protein [Pseudonocardia humida]|uniref:Erythromycin esterase family protein n=1 Tax=Pseudonocardia humida TaxID=2800819 RepID=A0ABT1A7E5_9PSEU|nr:erythromycin esterase family protein [Pseudonocardia humida]MCO1658754.1 erythromycin esterase family protein [Pseudonocardia humida]